MNEISAKLNQIGELNSILSDMREEITDLQTFLAENELIEEQQTTKIAIIKSSSEYEPNLPAVSAPDTNSLPSDDTSSSDSPTETDTKLAREKLPFAFLRSISHSAYIRYYNAYKEAKELITEMNPRSDDDTWNKIFLKIVLPVPDARALYLNLSEANEYLDTLALAKKYGKTLVRFHKIFRKMLSHCQDVR